MSRRAQAAFPLLACLFVAASLPFWWRFFLPPAPSAIVHPPVLTASEGAALDVMLRRAGLDPRALAAAGLSSQAATSVVQAAAAHVAQHGGDLTAADTAFLTAKPAADRLERKVQSGTATQEEIAAYPNQRAAANTAAAQRTAALDALFSAATANLTAPARATLGKIRANQGWQLPIEYLVADRTQAQWVALRDALAGERYCAEYHETLDAGVQTLLAGVRADGAVATATTGLATNSDSIGSAWASALSQ